MSMTIEERKARAREKLAKLDKATQGGRRLQQIDWKPKAKIFIHPDTDILDRRRVWFPVMVELSDEEKKKLAKKPGAKVRSHKLQVRPFTVPANDKECAFAALRQALKDRDDIDGDDVVLKVGSGPKAEEYCKGEILRWDDYSFKKSLIPRGEFVVAAVMVEHKSEKIDSPKLEILIAPKSLGEDLKREIKSEMDESGEDAGNPFLNPYPFIITYDENESGSDMYSARGRVTEKPSKEVAKLLESEPPDVEKEVEPDDPAEVLEMLKKVLVIDDLEFDIEETTGPTRKSKGARKAAESKAKAKAKAKDEDAEGDEDEDDEEEEEAPAARVSRKSRKPDPKSEVEDEEEDDEDEEDDEEEDKKSSKKWVEKKGSKKTSKPEPEEEDEEEDEDEEDEEDEEEEKPAPKKTSKSTKAATEKKKADPKPEPEEEDEDDEEEEDEEEEEKPAPKKSAKGKPAKSAKGKPATVATDEDDEEEADDEEEEDDEEDEEEKPAPKKASKAKESKPVEAEKPAEKAVGKVAKKPKVAEKAERKLGWVPKEGESYDVCPKCSEAIPQDATKCPHPFCDAEYEVDDDPFGES